MKSEQRIKLADHVAIVGCAISMNPRAECPEKDPGPRGKPHDNLAGITLPLWSSLPPGPIISSHIVFSPLPSQLVSSIVCDSTHSTFKVSNDG